jgi:hypothetical protein
VSDARLGDPQDLLKSVLSARGSSSASDLHATYSPVLRQLVTIYQQSTRGTVTKRFQLIVGTIITLLDPLPKTSLIKLINTSVSNIDGILDYLHSVLKVPSNTVSPIQLFHLLFYDFLVDQEQYGSDFFIDE